MNAQSNPWPYGRLSSSENRDLSAVETGILQAVAYSDIFDYPLTGSEIHRYLVGVRASWKTVEKLLDHGRPVSGLLASESGYFLIPGREEIVETRRRRAAVAARMWPRAERYGATIGQLPFVRMVAVTGALAMDNVDPGTDIDYLVITEPGRLWVCRALVVAMVRLAARRGDTICPNYFLSERALALGEPNLFTAHELAQMVPIVGQETYQRMCRLNSWAAWFLPNAFDAPRRVDARRGDGRSPAPVSAAAARPLFWNLAETILRTPLGHGLEQWEMNRKVRKLGRPAPPAKEASMAGGNGHAEVNFTAERCKGHFDNHRKLTLGAFSRRLRDLPVGFPEVTGPEAIVEQGGEMANE